MSDDGSFCVFGDNKRIVLWAGTDDPDVQRIAKLHQQLCTRVSNLVAAQAKGAALCDLASWVLDYLHSKFVSLACTLVRCQKEEAEVHDKQLTAYAAARFKTALSGLNSYTHVFNKVCALVDSAESAELQHQYAVLLHMLKEPGVVALQASESKAGVTASRL
jgi:hypothetical protein